MLIVEAKAHGGFTRKQVHNLDEARDLIQRGQIENAKNVRLIALASSAYLNRWKIAKRFDQAIAWSAVAAAYGAHREIYLRADDVYKDGKYAPARQLAN